MATVELKEGDVIVSQRELNELFAQRDEAERRVGVANATIEQEKQNSQNKSVLINQAILVVGEVEKLFPGLFDGKGLSNLNPMNIMGMLTNDKAKSLGPKCERLKVLIEEHKKNNPVILKA
jgi:hypothetical protein